MSTTITETDIRPSGTITLSSEHDVMTSNTTNEEITYEGVEESFLPANHGVTGHEPNTNPPNWLTNHRRMPPHRPPVTHPQWVAIGGPLPMRIFMWNMFSGCQILQWGYSVLSWSGLHDRGVGMYKIGNEW